MKLKLILLLSIILMHGCGSDTLPPNKVQCVTSSTINWEALKSLNCDRLSDYGLFLNPNNPTQSPNNPGIPYSLNSTLFTDHAEKFRFIFIPENTQTQYDDKNAFDFPLGSALVKVFALPSPDVANIIEVRLLILREKGWIGLPFLWDKQQEDAFLQLNGATVPFDFEYLETQHSGNYVVPSYGDCQTCHMNNNEIIPIGIKARHLNKTIEYDGKFTQQLMLWSELNLIENLPDISTIDTSPNWQDESQSLQNRAKAYLDINCAHCHSDGGSGALSGLRLEYWRKTIDYNHGVCNSSHGWRGGGFDIWPGEGEISSIPIRMRHTEPKDRMPPIGRSLVDEPAAQLISDWIDTLPYQSCAE